MVIKINKTHLQLEDFLLPLRRLSKQLVLMNLMDWLTWNTCKGLFKYTALHSMPLKHQRVLIEPTIKKGHKHECVFSLVRNVKDLKYTECITVKVNHQRKVHHKCKLLGSAFCSEKLEKCCQQNSRACRLLSQFGV